MGKDLNCYISKFLLTRLSDVCLSLFLNKKRVCRNISRNRMIVISPTINFTDLLVLRKYQSDCLLLVIEFVQLMYLAFF